MTDTPQIKTPFRYIVKSFSWSYQDLLPFGWKPFGFDSKTQNIICRKRVEDDLNTSPQTQEPTDKTDEPDNMTIAGQVLLSGEIAKPDKPTASVTITPHHYEWEHLWEWHNAEQYRCADKGDYIEAQEHLDRLTEINKMLNEKKESKNA